MKFTVQCIVVFLLILVFFVGFIVLLNNGVKNNELEKVESLCPNLLVRNGNKLSLLNSNMKEIVGVNPLLFNSLEDYKKYIIIEKNKGNHCPVLYIQEENNSQGKDIYKMYSDPFNIEPGLAPISIMNVMNTESMSSPIPVLDANNETSPFNVNNYPGFDYNGLNVGEFTKSEEVHNSTKYDKINDNAMDSNWVGVIKSRESVANGKYIENEVGKISYPNMGLK
jgi:hypothetical protein